MKEVKSDTLFYVCFIQTPSIDMKIIRRRNFLDEGGVDKLDKYVILRCEKKTTPRNHCHASMIETLFQRGDKRIVTIC